MSGLFRYGSKLLNAIATGWNRFFFEYSNPLAAACFRLMFGVTLLWNVLLRMSQTEFYFTEAGGISAEAASDLLPEFFRSFVSFYPRTIEGIWMVQISLVLALVVLILGAFGRVGTRLTALIALFCHLALMQRNYSIVYGADIVTTFWLFGLVFINASERLSLFYYLQVSQRRLVIEPAWSRLLSSVGMRLVQIQLCIIYGYTGLEKLKGGEWWDQTALWKVLSNEQLMTVDLSFLKNVPLLIALATWGTVLLEIYFPALVWQKATRKWILVSGWALHIGIALTMGLYIFSFTMMSAYLLFVNEKFLASVLRTDLSRNLVGNFNSVARR
jgi:hypothetical protein